MEDGVFLTKEFQEFAKDYVMFAHVTAMIEGRKDDELLVRLGGRAFPYLVLLDLDGTVLAEHRTAPTVEAFRETGKEVAAHFELRRKALAGDRDAVLAFALKRAQRFQINSRQLRREAARAAPLSPEEDAAVKEALRDLLFEEASFYARGEWYARMEKEGLVPQDEEELTEFWLGILAWAEFTGDVETYERVLGELRRLHGERAPAAGFFRQAQAKLEDLKADRAAEAKEPAEAK